MPAKRIAVTGLGAISALGTTVAENWAAVVEGRGGIAPAVLDASKYGHPPHHLMLAQVSVDVEALCQQRLGNNHAGSLDTFSRLALAAACEALDQAGLRGDPVLEEETGIVFGHGFGGLHALEVGYERFYGQGSLKVHPLTIPRTMMSAAASATAMAFGVKGPVFATSSACSSSSHAIAQAASMLATGQVDVVITGGSESISTPSCMRSWEAIRAISSTGCRPFSIDRDGMVLGEGAAMMVLEDWDRATARGAPVLGEFLGAGMSSDASHITQPSSEGQARAIRQAIRMAGAQDRDDLLISAHGTGTPLNDASETEALYLTFGRERAKTMPVIATKSAHGHLIGGSAALQAVLGLRALAEKTAPPILGYNGADPACDLDLVVGAPRSIDSGLLLQNSFAFGGLNAALVFGAAPN